MEESGVSKRPGAPNEFTTCSFTDTKCLSDEILVSELSDRPFRKDHLRVSEISGTNGHKTEFTNCSITGRTISICESGKSDVGGKTVGIDLLFKSERNSERQGLKDELADCSLSGKRLLQDEVGTCGITNKTVDLELLTFCQECEHHFIATSMTKCEVSEVECCPNCATETHDGRWVKAKLVTTSDLSEKAGLKDDIGQCEFTDIRCLSEELIRSDISGKRFRFDQSQGCEVTDRVGHESELEKCEFSGSVVCRDKLLTSNVSGKRGFREHFIRTETGRDVHNSELVTCEVSKTEIPKDEAKQSDVSGRVAHESKAFTSSVSGKIGFEDEGLHCGTTGEFVLHDEAKECAYSGDPVSPNALKLCSQTEQLVAARYLHTCKATKSLAIQDALQPIAIPKGYAIKEHTRKCQWLNDYVCINDLRRCIASNLSVHKSFVEDGMHHYLMGLVQKRIGTSNDFSKYYWFNTMTKKQFSKLGKSRSITSPSGEIVLYCFDVDRRLGIVTKKIVVAVNENGPVVEVIGQASEFHRSGLGFRFERSFIISPP